MKSKQILYSVTFFFRKLCPLWDNVEKIFQSGGGHIWQYGACALHAGYLRLHIHTNTHKHTYNCFSIATMVARTRLIVTSHVHSLSFCNLQGKCLLRGTNSILKTQFNLIFVFKFSPSTICGINVAIGVFFFSQHFPIPLVISFHQDSIFILLHTVIIRRTNWRSLRTF